MEIIPQGVWRWKIAAYLFLAGMGAGAYAVGVLGDLIGAAPTATRAGTALGIPLVAVSTLFLIWDLGHPMRFFAAALHPSTSWISRGFYILSALLIVGVINWVLVVPTDALSASPDSRAVLEIIGLAAAVATCVYTGILIGVVVSRPFWNSPLLPLLFLISAISTGIAGLFLCAPIFYGARGLAPDVALQRYLENLGQVDIALIILEAIAVYLYLAVVFDRAPEAANLLLRGPLSGLFWIGFVGMGLALPLIIEYLTFRGGLASYETAAAVVAGILVIVGGFILRALVLAAGIRSPLYVRAAFRVRPGV